MKLGAKVPNYFIFLVPKGECVHVFFSILDSKGLYIRKLSTGHIEQGFFKPFEVKWRRAENNSGVWL